MDSPLMYDEKIKREFGITDEFEVDPAVRLNFVRTQLDEIKKFLLRERVDLILGQVQADSKNELIASKGANQVTEKRSNIAQVVQSIKTLTKFINELESTL